MRKDTIRRKKATKNLKNLEQENYLAERMAEILANGKTALDIISLEVGRRIAEAIMYIEREEVAGPDYRPLDPTIQKWASQPGSLYLGDQKIKVQRPRLRGPKGEIQLKSYQKLKERDAFSEELLSKVMGGLSARKYSETVTDAANAFGVSPSSVSRHIVQATARELKEFQERDLSKFNAFAIFVDTVHRGGAAFMVALGINLEGDKMPLGFWEGSSENSDVCNELLADLERRGLLLPKRIIWVTDGGKGIIKALKDKVGKKLIHVRCMIHKSRNIQRQLAKKYRKEAHRRLKTALEQVKYADAKKMLNDLKIWLKTINESAAASLEEAFDELLTLHKYNIPSLLRKTLWTTNPIESMFSMVRDSEANIKRYRGSKMSQRWLAAVLLYCEKRFRKVKGYREIRLVAKRMEKITKEKNTKNKKQAA